MEEANRWSRELHYIHNIIYTYLPIRKSELPTEVRCSYNILDDGNDLLENTIN